MSISWQQHEQSNASGGREPHVAESQQESQTELAFDVETRRESTAQASATATHSRATHKYDDPADAPIEVAEGGSRFVKILSATALDQAYADINELDGDQICRTRPILDKAHERGGMRTTNNISQQLPRISRELRAVILCCQNLQNAHNFEDY